MHPLALLQIMMLMALANGTPIIAKKLLARRLSRPFDSGLLFFDQRPLFGPSKTIRGVLSSILVTTAGAPVLGLQPEVGALVACAAMVGDLFSSFVKRRLNLPSSSQAIGLDQVPESLFPLLLCRDIFFLSTEDIALGVGAFFVGELILSRVLYTLRLRDEPY